MISAERQELINQVFSMKEAIESTSGEWSEYKHWMHQTKTRGMSRSYCFSLFRAARIIQGVKGITLKENESKFLEQFDHFAQKFVSIAKDYVESSDSLLDGMEWFMYFLSVAERGEKHLKIARTIMTILPGMRAKLENVRDGFSKNYIGKYDVIRGHRTVIYFDMHNEGPKIHREVHVKVTCLNKNDELMLGSYTSYDDQFVHSGLLVFQKIEGEDSHPINKKTSLCSYRTFPKQFQKIPEEIRQYLSLKARNHTRVSRTIPNIGELKLWLDEYKPLTGMSTRFLELATPRVYFATPQGASFNQEEKTHINNLVEAYRARITEDETINLEVISKEESENSNSDKNMSLISLSKLKRTKYFILILSDIKCASYSLVLLGWALSTVKKILIIANEDAISERMLQMDTVNDIHVKTYPSIIESEFKVNTEIDRFLGINQ